ncbi:Voltage-dependent T-type calcium channel subunit alpha-1H [Anopheles sinensis]|uniref:Voltage-dependent T-type calcium channel subunit alpha-1H n=1 Tax=Anopheles sinensis TaxID=74873 RepID=A0A084WB79_ANOSI|nr:Voltage-dependent T-type calcium channel subunit alpha-1H [Anopheles sinensis]
MGNEEQTKLKQSLDGGKEWEGGGMEKDTQQVVDVSLFHRRESHRVQLRPEIRRNVRLPIGEGSS